MSVSRFAPPPPPPPWFSKEGGLPIAYVANLHRKIPREPVNRHWIAEVARASQGDAGSHPFLLTVSTEAWHRRVF